MGIPIEEIEIFKKLRDIKVVFDVGSRTDIAYYQARPELEYHLFEPNPEFFREVKHKAAGIQNIIVNNWGLGDVETSLDYYPRTQTFVPLEWDGQNSIGKLQVKTLDSYGVQPDFLKIDTEGFDYKVLLGAKETIKNTKYIQYEYWDGVRKFIDLLSDYDHYLITEPLLQSCLLNAMQPAWVGQLIPITEGLALHIDTIIIWKYGAGGNVLAVKKGYTI